MTNFSDQRITRRAVLIGATAASVIAGMPLSKAVPVPAAELVVPVRRGGWGFSFNGGEWWSGFDDGYATPEAALKAAVHEFGDDDLTQIQVAWCIPRQLGYPDMRDDVVEWLCMYSDGQPIERHLIRRLEEANEENDFDGEVADAFCGATNLDLPTKLLNAVAAALLRHDRIDLYIRMIDADREGPICGDEDPMLDILQRDEKLRAELDAALRAWGKANNLDDSPRTLDLEDEYQHNSESVAQLETTNGGEKR